MFWYPVHRHRFPPIASRASSAVGIGVVPQVGGDGRDEAGRAEPALQTVALHECPLHRTEPPSGARQPSIVVTSPPSTVTAKSRHERTASPSSSTVQAPQTPCSQPTWVPV